MNYSCGAQEMSRRTASLLISLKSGGPGENSNAICKALSFCNVSVRNHKAFLLNIGRLTRCSHIEAIDNRRLSEIIAVPKQSRKTVPNLKHIACSNFHHSKHLKINNLVGGLDMAMRYGDTSKWDAGWYRWLKPKFKCAWDYMTDKCSGTGVLRLDLEELSSRVCDEITRSEFDEVFAGRILWISNEKIWIPSSFPFRNRKPSAKNKAQKTQMEEFIELSRKFNVSDEVSSFAKKYSELLEAQSRLDGTHRESIENRILKIENRTLSLKEGVGENFKNPLFEIWNSNCKDLSKAVALSQERIKHCNARWMEKPDESYWTGIVKKMAESKFCNGDNERGWKADFDFFIKPNTHIRITEGKYQSFVKKKSKSMFVEG